MAKARPALGGVTPTQVAVSLASHRGLRSWTQRSGEVYSLCTEVVQERKSCTESEKNRRKCAKSSLQPRHWPRPCAVASSWCSGSPSPPLGISPWDASASAPPECAAPWWSPPAKTAPHHYILARLQLSSAPQSYPPASAAHPVIDRGIGPALPSPADYCTETSLAASAR